MLYSGDTRSQSPLIKDRLKPLDGLKADSQSDRSKVNGVKDTSSKRPPLDRSERTVSITEDVIDDAVSAATDIDKLAPFMYMYMCTCRFHTFSHRHTVTS